MMKLALEGKIILFESLVFSKIFHFLMSKNPRGCLRRAKYAKNIFEKYNFSHKYK